MIPAAIPAAIETLQASLLAATPVSQATSILKAALVTAGRSLVANIDGALALSVGALDDDDPTGFPGALVQRLLDLDDAATDQAALAEMRGTIGRAVFNLAQA